MPRPKPDQSTSSEAKATGVSDLTAKETSSTKARANLDQQRIVELVAVGQLPFPLDLPECEQQALAEAVQKIRRRRLIHHVAQAIALDLHGEGQNEKET